MFVPGLNNRGLVICLRRNITLSFCCVFLSGMVSPDARRLCFFASCETETGGEFTCPSVFINRNAI